MSINDDVITLFILCAFHPFLKLQLPSGSNFITYDVLPQVRLHTFIMSSLRFNFITFPSGFFKFLISSGVPKLSTTLYVFSLLFVFKVFILFSSSFLFLLIQTYFLLFLSHIILFYTYTLYFHLIPLHFPLYLHLFLYFSLLLFIIHF